MSRFTRFVVALAALLLMIGSAGANDVRMMTLGGAPYWKDAGDVDMWYGEIANYSDMVWFNFDMGQNNTFGSGIQLAKSEDTFGTYFLGICDNAGMAPSKVTLGYGYALEMVTLGVYYEMWDGGEEDTYYDLGFGMNYDLGDATNIDAAFMMGSYGEDNSAMNFGVRAFYDWKDGVTLVPVFGFGSTTVGDDEYTDMMFGLGFAYEVNDDNSLIVGFDYGKYSETVSDVDWEETTLPGFYIGLEHDVNDWLTVRAAGTKCWNKDDSDPVVEDYPFMFDFGFGFHVGDFDLDVAYDESRLFDGFNWFLGGDQNLPVYALQAKYYF